MLKFCAYIIAFLVAAHAVYDAGGWFGDFVVEQGTYISLYMCAGFVSEAQHETLPSFGFMVVMATAGCVRADKEHPSTSILC